MKIGFFDSGIGGLTVLHQAMLTLPEEEYIYYADTDNVPYGIKRKEDIIQYVDEAVQFIVNQGVKAVVIACNTATSVAIDYLREKYTIPILGMEPAVKPAMTKYTAQRVLVIATPLTVKEHKLQNLLQQYDDSRVDLLPLPNLVTLAEKGKFYGEAEEYLSRELKPYLLSDYSALILGCTHFNYFKDTFRNIFPEQVEFIDGSNGTINHLKRILSAKGQLEHNPCTVEYYKSGRLVTEERILKEYEKLHERLDIMLKY